MKIPFEKFFKSEEFWYYQRRVADKYLLILFYLPIIYFFGPTVWEIILSLFKK